MQINRLSNQYDNSGSNPIGIMPDQPSWAENRVKAGGGSSNGSSGGAHDDVSGISFDHDENNRFLSILGAPYSAQDDGHGKFTPAPRTRIPRHDHGTPGDNKRKNDDG